MWSTEHLWSVVPPHWQLPCVPLTTGIGYETAKSLCSKGFDVVIACRDQTRAANAVAKLNLEVPSARVEYLLLDLANLQSVRDAAARWLDGGRQVDVLLNNAGGHAAAWHAFDFHCCIGVQAYTSSQQLGKTVRASRLF